MLDFTSALYLGFDHASQSLPGWQRLTLGKPAALEPLASASRIESRLATLIGTERALLATSTLHLFWDLFTVLARREVNIFLDAGSYPIVRWGVERAACSGTRVRIFRAHDPKALHQELRNASARPPVIVTDGYCPGCGRLAPLAEYLALAGTYNGFVVLDDSQALGIFGKPQAWAPYGSGGGGSMQRARLSSDRLIIGSSLAKAFGVPVAVLAGSASILDEFERHSATRVHCSPPSAAVISAAYRALEINHRCGDALRMILARNVARFRHGLTRMGLLSIPSFFPVQPILFSKKIDAASVTEHLERSGVQAVLNRGEDNQNSRISFLLTARHSPAEIDRALLHLHHAISVETRNRVERSSLP